MASVILEVLAIMSVILPMRSGGKLQDVLVDTDGLRMGFLTGTAGRFLLNRWKWEGLPFCPPHLPGAVLEKEVSRPAVTILA